MFDDDLFKFLSGSTRKQTALLSWWGALSGSGTTIGDFLAVQAVRRALVKQGFDCLLACRKPAPAHGLVDWQEVLPSQIDAHVFVCGPIISENKEQMALLNKFGANKTFIIGVSLLQQEGLPVKGMVARDTMFSLKGVESHFDLALSHPCFKNLPPRPEVTNTVGLILRGKQSEYIGACYHDEIAQAVENTGCLFSVLDTRINSCDSITEFFRKLRQCKVVITTRLHGALFAAACSVPYIAIDQIEGGAKLTKVVKRFAPETLLSVDKLPALLQSLEQANSVEPKSLDERAKRATALAKQALSTSVELIQSSQFGAEL